MSELDQNQANGADFKASSSYADRVASRVATGDAVNQQVLDSIRPDENAPEPSSKEMFDTLDNLAEGSLSVVRSSGEADAGWTVDAMSADGKTVGVKKNVPGGVATKVIPLKDVYTRNKGLFEPPLNTYPNTDVGAAEVVQPDMSEDPAELGVSEVAKTARILVGELRAPNKETERTMRDELVESLSSPQNLLAALRSAEGVRPETVRQLRNLAETWVLADHAESINELWQEEVQPVLLGVKDKVIEAESVVSVKVHLLADVVEIFLKASREQTFPRLNAIGQTAEQLLDKEFTRGAVEIPLEDLGHTIHKNVFMGADDSESGATRLRRLLSPDPRDITDEQAMQIVDFVSNTGGGDVHTAIDQLEKTVDGNQLRFMKNAVDTVFQASAAGRANMLNIDLNGLRSALGDMLRTGRVEPELYDRIARLANNARDDMGQAQVKLKNVETVLNSLQ